MSKDRDHKLLENSKSYRIHVDDAWASLREATDLLEKVINPNKEFSSSDLIEVEKRIKHHTLESEADIRIACNHAFELRKLLLTEE